MNTLLTSTYYCDVLINLDNVLHIERASDKESIIYFVNGEYLRTMDNFDALVEVLHEQQ